MVLVVGVLGGIIQCGQDMVWLGHDFMQMRIHLCSFLACLYGTWEGYCKL